MSGSGQADPGSRSRDSGLDFLKGFLVLVMVVHHSLEYFLGPRYPVIKYFDFVTGAFVFVAGFIVSSISGVGDKREYGCLPNTTCDRRSEARNVG